MPAKKTTISPESFLATYREYESLVRSRRGLDPRSFEERLVNPLAASRLRLCRQFRNYLVHENDPDFIGVTPVMADYLQKIVDEFKMEGDILKNHLMSTQSGTVKYSDKVSDVMSKLISLKQNEIIIRYKNGSYGVLSIHEVAKALLKSKVTKAETLLSSKNFHFASPLDDIDELPQGIILCTDNGEDNGELLGVKY